jgi:hypothetical protein
MNRTLQTVIISAAKLIPCFAPAARSGPLRGFAGKNLAFGRQGISFLP